MDSANKEALYIREKANDLKHKRVLENLKTTEAVEKLKNYEYIKESGIPYQDIQRFPSKEQWENIDRRTLPETDKIIEENKAKTEQLRLIPSPPSGPFPKVIEDALNTIISFEFLDTPLSDVVSFIREKTNINMITESGAGNVPITLKLKDVPFRTALKYILPKGYEYVVEGDIIHIYKQKMELRVYDVRDILINLDDKEPLKFDITAAVSSQMALAKGAPARVKDASERLLDLIELVVTSIETASWSTNVGVVGNPASGIQRRINVPGQGEGSCIARVGQPGDLVVVHNKYVHKQIEDLLASLRSSQTLQVSIETRFISVSDEFMQDMGANFSKFFSDDVSINKTAMAMTNGLSIDFAILNNSTLAGFFKAVQESKDSEILTSPRITLSNTQRGNIAVVKTTNYIQSSAVSEGVTTPVIGTVPDGTTFDVRPIVSTDRKYVYLEVAPAVFKVEEIQKFNFATTSTAIPQGTGGTAIGSTTTTIQLPVVNVSQLSATVCVPDKSTLMIGGLGSINKTNNTTGIPILSKIPLIKRLFSQEQKNNTKSNLIILIKPTILIRDELEANLMSQTPKKTEMTDLRFTPEKAQTNPTEPYITGEKTKTRRQRTKY
jgi:type II secretory pathway component GspD/PulD (secretin)